MTATAPVAGLALPLEVLIDPTETIERWAAKLRRTGLAEQTKDKYIQQVRAFLAWFTEQTDSGRPFPHRANEIMLDPDARDYVVRDYRRWLLTDGGSHPRAPKGVDLALTSLANLYGWIGLGRPNVAMAAGRARTAPKAFDADALRAIMRAAQRRGVRDHALTSLLLSTGIRGGEVAALNDDDLWLSDRKGEVAVRAGKGDKPRRVAVNAQARDALRPWLAERTRLVSPGERALFVTRTGARMAERTIRYTMSEIGKDAEQHCHAHKVRHTFATLLARSGADLALIGELLGHADLNTTRIYTMPSANDAADAVEAACIDY